jgi:hypothetical protein
MGPYLSSVRVYNSRVGLVTPWESLYCYRLYQYDA